MKLFPLAFAAAVVAAPAFAAPVDLSGWTVEDRAGSTSPNWNVAPDKNSVRQTRNSRPSVFYGGGTSAQGKQLSGSFSVSNTSDDDFAGFVLGFNSGEMDGSAGSIDYWLIDWKQDDQYWSQKNANGLAGLALSHVTQYPGDESGFWNHSDGVTEVQRAASLGSTGWVENQTYTFDLIFTPDMIRVNVDGNTELLYTSAMHGSTFTDGAFGFYNYSQDNVTYAGITEDTAPVPVPATLPLLAGAFGLLALRRRAQA